MESKYKIGDVVNLKSSKLARRVLADAPIPLMTVVKCLDGIVTCAWFMSGEFSETVFPVDAVELYVK